MRIWIVQVGGAAMGGKGRRAVGLVRWGGGGGGELTGEEGGGEGGRG